jgi:hypothetical protein
MKIEISLEKENEEKEKPMAGELSPEQKAAIAKKIKKNIALSRMERSLLSGYLLEDKEED